MITPRHDAPLCHPHRRTLPSAQTIADGRYAPLSRPLDPQVNRARLARPEVQACMRFTLEHIEDNVAPMQIVPSLDDEYATDRAALESLLSSVPAS